MAVTFVQSHPTSPKGRLSSAGDSDYTYTNMSDANVPSRRISAATSEAYVPMQYTPMDGGAGEPPSLPRQGSVEAAIRQSMRLARHMSNPKQQATASVRRTVPVINEEGVTDDVYEDTWAASQGEGEKLPLSRRDGSLVAMPKAVQVQVRA